MLKQFYQVHTLTHLGTGTYYPLRETGKMDIDVS